MTAPLMARLMSAALWDEPDPRGGRRSRRLADRESSESRYSSECLHSSSSRCSSIPIPMHSTIPSISSCAWIPCASVGAMVAARSLIARLWPLLLVVGSTLLLGRVFCGYFCPLGTMLDCFSGVLGGRSKPRHFKNLHAVKYLILFGTLAAASVGVSATHFFDPVNIAERTGTLVVRQAVSLLVVGLGYVPVLGGLVEPLETSLAFEVRA